MVEHESSKDNVERAEEVALYVLAALTVYHPKTFHPIQFFRHQVELLKDWIGAKGIKGENIERKRKLDEALRDMDMTIPQETIDLVQTYWEEERKRGITALEKRQIVEIPDDEDPNADPDDANLKIQNPNGEDEEFKKRLAEVVKHHEMNSEVKKMHDKQGDADAQKVLKSFGLASSVHRIMN